MVYTRLNKRPMFYRQRLDVEAERDGKEILRNIIGLKTAEYRTLWYDGDSCKEPYGSQFVGDPKKDCADDQ
ncbi:hypothetical protein FRC11_002155, partial [Ceratobasidium sp. 423]